MTQPQRTDVETVKEISREARDLIENRAFKVVKALLHKQWVGELLIETDREKKDDLIAKLKVMDEVERALDSLMKSPQFMQQRGVDVR